MIFIPILCSFHCPFNVTFSFFIYFMCQVQHVIRMWFSVYKNLYEWRNFIWVTTKYRMKTLNKPRVGWVFLLAYIKDILYSYTIFQSLSFDETGGPLSYQLMVANMNASKCLATSSTDCVGALHWHLLISVNVEIKYIISPKKTEVPISQMGWHWKWLEIKPYYLSGLFLKWSPQWMGAQTWSDTDFTLHALSDAPLLFIQV